MSAREHGCAGTVTLFRKVAMVKGWKNMYISNANLKPQSILMQHYFCYPPKLFNKAFQ